MAKRIIRMILLTVLLIALTAGCAAAERISAGQSTETALPSSAPTDAPTEPTLPTHVRLSGRDYPRETEAITVDNGDYAELCDQIPIFSNLETVTLTGTLPDAAQLLDLKARWPGITFVWDFDCFGTAVNTLTESLDLSGVPMENTEELEALLPQFYRLKTVDMCGCGLSNDQMDALRRHFPDTKFVWEIQIARATLRTDITYFMAFQHGLPKKTTTDYSNLRYCTDLVVLDLGHYQVKDLSFLPYLTKLEYLLLCDTSIEDITTVGTCTQLRFLELFLNPLVDFWPLTNLSNLEDLNLGHTPGFHKGSLYALWDYQPLLQMTWLDRLWLPGSHLTQEEEALLYQSLPNTYLTFHSPGSTEQGWRYSPNNYAQRDIMGMYYLKD